MAGSFRARLHGPLGREQLTILPPYQYSMKAQQCRGFEDDRGTDQPARAHEDSTEAGDRAIRGAKIGRPSSGPIEDQQLRA